MTHSDIKEKFLIEYDKADIASSYPSLTDYEIATILDKAYLALIAQKLTGNNPRQVPFEGDTKAIEDIRPLIKSGLAEVNTSFPHEATNEYVFDIPEDFLYYLQSKIDLGYNAKGIDDKNHDINEVNLVTHEVASKFMATSHNLPWVNIPVCCLQSNIIRVFVDPVKQVNDVALNLMYIKKPNKFVGDLQSTNEFQDNQFDFELSDTMAEELINLAITLATEIVESPRLTTKLNTRSLES